MNENKTQQTNTKIEMNNLCPDCDHGLRGGMPCESCQDPIHENEMIQHKEIGRLKAENKKLRAFAREVMEAWPDGGIEGDDLQEIAHRHGMLAPETLFEPCGEWCKCNRMNGLDSDDWKGGVECYRRTALLTGNRNAARGTTAQVALQHGRQYLGCELNPDYEPLQQQRILA